MAYSDNEIVEMLKDIRDHSLASWQTHAADGNSRGILAMAESFQRAVEKLTLWDEGTARASTRKFVLSFTPVETKK